MVILLRRRVQHRDGQLNGTPDVFWAYVRISSLEIVEELWKSEPFAPHWIVIGKKPIRIKRWSFWRVIGISRIGLDHLLLAMSRMILVCRRWPLGILLRLSPSRPTDVRSTAGGATSAHIKREKPLAALHLASRCPTSHPRRTEERSPLHLTGGTPGPYRRRLFPAQCPLRLFPQQAGSPVTRQLPYFGDSILGLLFCHIGKRLP